MSPFDSLTREQYINLETFRKNGTGIKTPVWFVRDGERLWVRTVANSGKVKRIRNNGQVNLAACKADGALQGEWLPATAREVQDKDSDRQSDRLLGQKYGLMKVMFGLMSALQGRKYTVLEITAR